MFKFNFSLVAFPAFDINFLVFYKVSTLITDIFELFFAVVNTSLQSQKGRHLLLLLRWPLWKIMNICKLSVHKALMHSVGSHKKIAKNTYKISNFFFLIRIFIINRENLIKIGRAESNTSNREGWNVRV